MKNILSEISPQQNTDKNFDAKKSFSKILHAYNMSGVRNNVVILTKGLEWLVIYVGRVDR